MNREIKFRAISTNTGKFVYGYFGYDWDSKNDLKPMIQSEPSMNGTSFSKTIIDINTLGQYIGLEDKNGTDIYEGDIVTYNNPFNDIDHKQIIKWDDKFACFALYEKYNDKYAKESDWVKIFNIEIVGNVLENTGAVASN